MVVLLSGAGGWSWCCAEQPRVPIKTILENQITNDEQSLANLAKVVKGMEVVDRIAAVKTSTQNNMKDVPVAAVTITAVKEVQ